MFEHLGKENRIQLHWVLFGFQPLKQKLRGADCSPDCLACVIIYAKA